MKRSLGATTSTFAYNLTIILGVNSMQYPKQAGPKEFVPPFFNLQNYNTIASFDDVYQRFIEKYFRWHILYVNILLSDMACIFLYHIQNLC